MFCFTRPITSSCGCLMAGSSIPPQTSLGRREFTLVLRCGFITIRRAQRRARKRQPSARPGWEQAGEGK